MKQWKTILTMILIFVAISTVVVAIGKVLEVDRLIVYEHMIVPAESRFDGLITINGDTYFGRIPCPNASIRIENYQLVFDCIVK